MSSATLPTPHVSVQQIIDELIAVRQQGGVASAANFDGTLTTAEQAYEVQAAVAKALGWFGTDFPRYWKSGGANREATLTHAPLPPAGVWNSPAEAGSFIFHRRGIEAEVALRLSKSVDHATALKLDEAGASSMVDAMAVSLEVVDSRWQECMTAPALMRLADLQCHGALIVGEWQPWQERDWAQQVCRVTVGEQPVVERRGTHPVGNPTWGLAAWLRHATRDGATVPAGTVVTTGTWVGILDAQPGDLVVASFEGIGSAQVQL